MGLAAYGDPSVLRDVLLSRFHQEPGSFRILETNNVYFSRMLSSQFPKIDVAAAYQHVLEVVAAAYVSHYLHKTGIKHLVLSGGVVANVKLNQRLMEIPGVEGIFIHPNMGDGGCGTGAACSVRGHSRVGKRLNDVYFGRIQQAESSKRSIAQLPFWSTRPSAGIALLAAGKVVARFEGRMMRPARPRPRSILYHAKEPAVNQWLNQRLGRTEFMPFAPATLEHRRQL